MSLSPDARRAAIAVYTMRLDLGATLRWSEARRKVEALFGEDADEEDVDRAVNELEAAGLVIVVEKTDRLLVQRKLEAAAAAGRL